MLDRLYKLLDELNKLLLNHSKEDIEYKLFRIVYCYIDIINKLFIDFYISANDKLNYEKIMEILVLVDNLNKNLSVFTELPAKYQSINKNNIIKNILLD